jgi:ABC-type nitrate/sulfonate/bicarbonate transport system substrate-binding protein
MQKGSRVAGAAIIGSSLLFLATPSAADTQLKTMVFQGVQNLPLFAAQAKGFFSKRGLTVEMKIAPNSVELRNGLAEGRYHIVHAAIDQAFAMVDLAKVDVAVVIGRDNSFNHLIVQPEITSVADLKGKTLLVDVPNTAYAFQAYEMLRQHGLGKGDYEIKIAGATYLRLDAMMKDKTATATMLYPPFSIRAQQAGFRDLGSAAQALGAYQGYSGFVLRSWASGNVDNLIAYLQAYIEGLRWSLDPANKNEAIGLLVERLNLSSDIAEQSYAVATNSNDGFDKDGRLNLEGVEAVLKLRAAFEGGMPAPPDRYIDLSYYRTALAGL